MKFSKSLLKNKDIGNKIFNSSIEKTKELLSDVFGLDFINKDTKIKEINQEDHLYKFNVVFNLKEREISAILNFEAEKEGFIQEVLTINEIVKETIQINNIPRDYKKAINKVMDILEEKYDVIFTPLNPEEKDNNIQNIKENNLEKSWEVVFIHDYRESEFKAIFNYNELKEPSLTVIEYKKHIIYFE